MADLNLYRRIVELQAEIVKVSKRNSELEHKCQELENILRSNAGKEVLHSTLPREAKPPKRSPESLSPGVLMVAKAWCQSCVSKLFA
jgi:hypothetical protein